MTLKVPDLLSPITKLFDFTNIQPIDIEAPVSPPVIVPTISRPIPTPCPIQTNMPHPLANSLPSTTSLHTDDIELTSLDDKSHIKAKVTDEQLIGNMYHNLSSFSTNPISIIFSRSSPKYPVVSRFRSAHVLHRPKHA